VSDRSVGLARRHDPFFTGLSRGLLARASGGWSQRAMRLGALCLGLLVVAGCAPDPAREEAQFLAELQRYRALKDEAFKGPDSPVPPERRSELLPLDYFAPSVDYRVPAVLRPSGDGAIIEMPTTTGQLRRMVRVGRLEFTLRGEQLALSAFVEAGSRDLNRLFVPFIDMTSGTETYPAGRYMDLERTPTGLYIIDFNRAYHPFCYYDPAYDCPYPPRENRLEMPVRAGERMRI
jgi:uncharacterized protein